MANEVEISIERIREIARTTMTGMHDDAHTQTRDFSNTKLGEGAFGEVPQALEFAAQQEAAHQVFVKTVNDVLKELEEFGRNLLSTADSHSSNDEAVEQTMAGMNRRYGHGHRWAAQQTYNRERTDNEPLDVETKHGAQHAQRDGGAHEGDQHQKSEGTRHTWTREGPNR